MSASPASPGPARRRRASPARSPTPPAGTWFDSRLQALGSARLAIAVASPASAIRLCRSNRSNGRRSCASAEDLLIPHRLQAGRHRCLSDPLSTQLPAPLQRNRRKTHPTPRAIPPSNRIADDGPTAPDLMVRTDGTFRLAFSGSRSPTGPVDPVATRVRVRAGICRAGP